MTGDETTWVKKDKQKNKHPALDHMGWEQIVPEIF